ncbi:PP2C family serine/threonine-protein phosphatase [Limnospira indica]|uniref:PP2C family serine/threonine-protein phosphatase n=1 Tax=Limnospira indica TaxID=147322 RepID=UPI0018623BD0|nr:PP2C family serine/threonine-protein phosphatase [Limnospira indica]QNH57018.1 MAG: protein phosphatase 2C domain-containing protein [Limnospira indica BM01]
MSNHDPNQDLNLEKLIPAIFWKVGIQKYSDELKETWEKFKKSDNYEEDKILKIINNLADIYKEVLKIQFDIKNENSGNYDNYDDVAKLYCSLLDILTSEHIQSLPDFSASKDRFKTAISKALEKKSPQLPPLSLSDKSDKTEYILESESTSNPITPPWQYHPVPDQEKEGKPHDEFYSKSHQSPPEGLKLIGTRVRGKMHKHQGTNCDDWFEFDTVDKWTIIAVSDGAGSKKFSRIGAKISCQAAVKSLKKSLESFSLCEPPQTALEKDFDRDDKWMFKGDKARELQQHLYTALSDAYQKVEEKANKLKNYPSYNKSIGGKKLELDIKDLSATLLLAIHTKIHVNNSTSYDFVLTCQVGDGMLAAISHKYTLKLLGKPDIGEHGGQTDFLTSSSKLEHSNLVQKTFPFIGDLKALMIMTDGVSDDYFPNDPCMLDLYGDLILNRVINIPNVDAEEIEKELQKTRLKTPDDVRDNHKKFQDELERILDEESKEPKKVSICSIANYAKQLGKDIKVVLESPGLLNAGLLPNQMCQECKEMTSEEKLKIWLDSYYRRGSFDDRTLVVLYREEH